MALLYFTKKNEKWYKTNRSKNEKNEKTKKTKKTKKQKKRIVFKRKNFYSYYIMPLYSCTLCDFHTFKKYDFSRHLKTKKHLKRIENDKTEGAGGLKKTKSSPKEKKRPKMTQNDPKMTQNDPKKTQNDPKKFECKYCFRKFSTKAHKRRHELHRCKNDKNIDYELKLERMRKQFEKEKLISQDEEKTAQEQVQKITDQHTGIVDELIAAKEKELMTL